MKLRLGSKVLQRELGEGSAHSQISALYGDQELIDDLDIVNELAGHDGCVNALSWSRSGRLLASGSDDKLVNIYSYLPDHSTSQFKLATTIQTGHEANIFSVKFMPQSNDRTVITCAADHTVRVFDVTRSSGAGRTWQHHTDRSTCKVFRSHNSQVKRLVTEASPFYFLSCSEDGDVRQWDIRQPESTYPESGGPPPLISYSKYEIELLTISCSPTQPHYIALGGRHLHCFLHDRRMLGRNKLDERGGSIPSFLRSGSTLEDATRCVAKFAPYGQPKAGRNDARRHISACKLGTTNPNELIASWMGDDIYSFDIRRDQASQENNTFTTTINTLTSTNSISANKKRKRVHGTGESPSNGPNHRPRATESDESHPASSFLVRAGGRVIAWQPQTRARADDTEQDPDSAVGHAQRVRTLKNSISRSHFNHSPDERHDEMLEILVTAADAFEWIDNHIANRTYPLTSQTSAVDYELKLRADRAKIWRFAQASGTLARVLLGYKTQPVPDRRAQAIDFEPFESIRSAPRESSDPLHRHEQFGYEFIKAVLLWLDSGLGTVLREFSNDSHYAPRGPQPRSTQARRRLPVPRDAGVDALDEYLIPYLLSLAADLPIEYSGHGGRGEDPRNRDIIFENEMAAVRALGQAMKYQFSDLQGPNDLNPGSDDSEETSMLQSSLQTVMSRDAAIKFWGFRVCMAVLGNASIDINYSFVHTAFENAFARDMVSDEESDNDLYVVNSSDEGSDSETSSSEVARTSRNLSKKHAGRNVPTGSHLRKYQGHANAETTKDVNFFGLDDEYIVSGSDCGNLFIWDKKTKKLINILRGDNETVNVVQAHPYEPLLAVSGIDSTIKIFSPDAHARRLARKAIGITSVDPSTFSQIGMQRRRLRDRLTQDRGTQHNGGDSTSSPEESRELTVDVDSDPENSGEEEIAPQGLQSRKEMRNEYLITNENDMNMRNNNNRDYISRGVMQLLAARLGAPPDMVDNNEDCVVM